MRKWSIEKCLELAQLCETLTEFRTKHFNAYCAIKNNNWYHSVLDVAFPNRKKLIKWTYDYCKKEALKYKYKSDFRRNSSGAHKHARLNGWLDEICTHMELKGNRFNKCIYVYEFPDNHAYVGLTFDIERRILERKSKQRDSVTQHINKFNIEPKLIILTDYLPVLNAIEMENFYYEQYKSNGWVMLNKVKTGSVGSVRKWTKEKCVEEAKKYKKRGDFIRANNGAYEAAYRYGWLDECLLYIPMITKPHYYWTKERCESVFKKYKSTKEVKKHAITAYHVSYKNGWLNEFKKHLINGRMPNGYWTKERCIDVLKKCKSKSEFRKNHRSAYMTSHKFGWLNEIYKIVNL